MGGAVGREDYGSWPDADMPMLSVNGRRGCLGIGNGRAPPSETTIESNDVLR
jgi:hypothetical protein